MGIPCEYSFWCMSGCLSASHSSHFFVVPPNSQYCCVCRQSHDRARRVPVPYLLLVVVCILFVVSDRLRGKLGIALTATVCDLDW
jgi:hypothetical protein